MSQLVAKSEIQLLAEKILRAKRKSRAFRASQTFHLKLGRAGQPSFTIERYRNIVYLSLVRVDRQGLSRIFELTFTACPEGAWRLKQIKQRGGARASLNSVYIKKHPGATLTILRGHEQKIRAGAYDRAPLLQYLNEEI